MYGPRIESPPVDKCLTAFLRVGDATDDEILRFARTWGPLGLCEHGRPFGHADCLPWGNNYSELGARDRDWEQYLWYSESLADWRALARDMRESMTIAIDVRDGRGRRGQWVKSADPDWPGLQPTPGGSDVAMHLDDWIKDTGMRPYMEWVESERAFRLALSVDAPFDRHWYPHVGGDTWPVGTLFGLLVAQLATALQTPLYRCEECGKAYPSERRPRSDRKRRCKSCAERSRLASKRRWWRKAHPPRPRESSRDDEGRAAL